MDKYNVDPIHRMAMEAIGVANMMLAQNKGTYENLIKSENDMHSFGHILHPTLYRDMIQSKNFALQTRMVKAALAFIREIEAVQKEVGIDGLGKTAED